MPFASSFLRLKWRILFYSFTPSSSAVTIDPAKSCASRPLNRDKTNWNPKKMHSNFGRARGQPLSFLREKKFCSAKKSLQSANGSEGGRGLGAMLYLGEAKKMCLTLEANKRSNGMVVVTLS